MSFTLIEDNGTYEDPHGETGGPEYNLGREFSRRFTWKNEEDGTFRTAESTYFVHARDEETGEEIDWTDYSEILERAAVATDEELEDGLGINFYVEELNEFTVHTDPEDPWDYEWEDMQYGEGSEQFFSKLEDAEEWAKRAANRESPEFYSPENFGK